MSLGLPLGQSGRSKVMITEELAEELKAIYTEGEFNSKWSLIETYHKAGELLKDIHHDELQGLAKKIGRSERTLYYSVKFYQTYPDLNLLPEGKNVSMNKIITKYLTTPKEKEEHKHTPLVICSGCKQRMQVEAVEGQIVFSELTNDTEVS